MQKAAIRMQQLITDLLAFSRISTTERKFEKINLNVIVTDIKNDFKEAFEEKHAIIEATELTEVNIIPFQFHQVMQNLIDNALKFSNPAKAPHIIIKSELATGDEFNKKQPDLLSDQTDHPTGKLSPETNYCHISVTDNGIGFDPQYKGRVFELFQRLHGKEAYHGTGIGLAIVKKIIENHNGTITATGELNKGSTFDIYIPAA
jgi:signal transduction histidine kinase